MPLNRRPYRRAPARKPPGSGVGSLVSLPAPAVGAVSSVEVAGCTGESYDRCHSRKNGHGRSDDDGRSGYWCCRAVDRSDNSPSAASAMTVPGPKTAAAPAARELRDVTGRDDAADHDHDVRSAEIGQARLQRRDQGEVPGRQRVHPDDVHVGVDRLLGNLFRSGEQRADIDVEAQVGERGDDDLLPAVVTVLAHLGDQDPRPAALCLGEPVGRRQHLGDQGAVPRFCPVHPGDRTDHRGVPAEHLLQRIGDLPDGGLRPGRVDREREQVVRQVAGGGVPGAGARRGQRVQGPQHRGGVPFGAQLFEFARSARPGRPGCRP